MNKNHIFQVTTKHLHLDLFVDFQQKVSKVFQVPHTKEKQGAVFNTNSLPDIFQNLKRKTPA